VADATLDALREVLGESLDELRRGVDGLSVAQLNARPAGGDTNSIAVIVTHVLGSTRSWLSLAMGAPLPDRDRDAEFRTVADDGFADWTEDAIARCLGVLDGATWDPTRVGTPNWSARLASEPRTAAYWVAHALAHLGEHVGHLHMTRELLDREAR
jgi:uncharacterized damage-inducible protein DinB